MDRYLHKSKTINKCIFYGQEILHKMGEVVPPSGSLLSFGHFLSGQLRSEAVDYPGDDVQGLLAQLHQSGRLFEDPVFPADDRSLFVTRRFRKSIEWRRPFEIISNPEFFVDGASRFDVTQGELGDCWLLAAVSNLTLHPSLFCQVVPPEQGFRYGYTGLFFFRFWRFGKWIEVAVDDRLPTIDGRLVFLRSSSVNEFWSALFEKAYAKLYGSYEALTGGRPSIAMDDFTGGVSEIFELQKGPQPDLFQIMFQGFERGSLMACSIEPNPRILEEKCSNGLVRGHAYSITSVKYCQMRSTRGYHMVPLIRVRNPWGNETEWNGAWSDQSREWRSVTVEEQQRLGLSFERDGEFWIAYEDFVKNFSSVEMTNINLQSLTEKDLNNSVRHFWDVKVFEGSWTRGVTAGGCANYPRSFWSNPKYSVTLKEEDDGDRDLRCTMIVALLQKPVKAVNASKKPNLLGIGFAVYPIASSGTTSFSQDMNSLRNSKEIPGLSSYINYRQVSHRFKLPPGCYCIIPSTYQPGEEASFLLRVFSEKPNIIQQNDSSIGFAGPNAKVLNFQPGGGNVAAPPFGDNQMRQVFDRLAGNDREMDWLELQSILNKRFQDQAGFQGFSKDACRSMVAMLDLDKSGKLGYEEFQHLWNIICMWKNAFQQHDIDRSGYLSSFEFRDALLTAGFRISNDLFSSLLVIYGNKNKDISFDDFVLCSIRMSKAIRAFTEKDHMQSNMASFTLEEFLQHAMCM